MKNGEIAFFSILGVCTLLAVPFVYFKWESLIHTFILLGSMTSLLIIKHTNKKWFTR